ncbi:hypothetical protein FB451DRAFT_1569420 [Mycena latifolia]|nr:hypothetical protein FB451DRAFT_1569420 [Mycena latifolia]
MERQGAECRAGPAGSCRPGRGDATGRGRYGTSIRTDVYSVDARRPRERPGSTMRRARPLACAGCGVEPGAEGPVVVLAETVCAHLGRQGCGVAAREWGRCWVRGDVACRVSASGTGCSCTSSRTSLNFTRIFLSTPHWGVCVDAGDVRVEHAESGAMGGSGAQRDSSACGVGDVDVEDPQTLLADGWRIVLRRAEGACELALTPHQLASRFEGNAGFQWDANEDCIDEYCTNVRMFLTSPHALYIYSLARGRVVGVWAPRAPSPVPGSRGPRDAKEQEKAIGTPCAFEAARRFIVVVNDALVILAHPSLHVLRIIPARPPHRHSPRSRSSRCRGASSRSYPPAASTPAHSLLAREPRVAVALDTGRARAQSGVQDVLVFDPVDGVLSLRRVTVALEAAHGAALLIKGVAVAESRAKRSRKRGPELRVVSIWVQREEQLDAGREGKKDTKSKLNQMSI